MGLGCGRGVSVGGGLRERDPWGFGGCGEGALWGLWGWDGVGKGLYRAAAEGKGSIGGVCGADLGRKGLQGGSVGVSRGPLWSCRGGFCGDRMGLSPIGLPWGRRDSVGSSWMWGGAL